MEIKNCFIRSTDDSICIKAHGLIADTSTVQDVTKVYAHNNVLSGMPEPGNAIELGYGLQSEITISYLSCDIIHCQYEGNMGGAASPSIRRMAVMCMTSVQKYPGRAGGAEAV